MNMLTKPILIHNSKALHKQYKKLSRSISREHLNALSLASCPLSNQSPYTKDQNVSCLPCRVTNRLEKSAKPKQIQVSN